MISWFSAAMIGTFRSLLFHPWVICSLGGPQSHGSPVVVFLDRGYPRFWNFYSTHPVDVVRVKSYMNCLFDSARVVLRVTINEGKFDTTILREPDCQLTTSVYRKPTHTDQYLAYDSHHPRSVKRGIVKCLYERAKGLVARCFQVGDYAKISVSTTKRRPKVIYWNTREIANRSRNFPLQ